MNGYKKFLMALVLACGISTAMPVFAAEASVVTNKVWLSGATHIFGRMTVSGITSGIKSQGFCYSETNERPTIDDQTCTAYLSNNGNIYRISNLTPSTVYYIRAYVQKTNGDVVYGEPIKAITRPKGSVNYGIRDGFPADALARIQSASKQAIDLWNEYTGIKGLYVNIGYGADTPTADCSYGGWMRVGPNASYQKTGTLLHEMLHAIGVGTHATWYGPSFLRANSTSGYWLGTRTTRALRFWNNNPTEQLNGDGTHMWPYGINGAHEDAGTEVLYIGNSVLAEALGEDGLAPTSSQFAIPAYVFEQDDNTKYYIKNESYGLGSKFLSVASDGKLYWGEMTSSEALSNDQAAWYVTFDPVTCYYSLKNVATGRYLSYYALGADGMRTKAVNAPTATEKFHFLPSPVEVATINGESRSAYWMAYVQNNTAYCLAANSNKTQVVASNLSFAQNAGGQRWLLLNAQEVSVLGESFRPALDKFNEKMVKWEALLQVPHTEVTEGADAEYQSALEELASKTQGLSADELDALATDAEDAARTFLSKVQATDPNQPFDITFFVKNPTLASSDGWTANNSTELPTINYSCGEFYEKNLDVSQKLSSMPKGTYEMKVQGFQRPGSISTVFTDYANGNNNVNPFIYLSNAKNKQVICNIMQDAQDQKQGKGKESTVGTQYVPNDMQSASAYFAKGLYDNTVQFYQSTKRLLTIGLKGTNSESNYWTIFANVRLYYYGLKVPTTGIHEIKSEEPIRQQGVYTLSGLQVRKNSDNLVGLPSGIYIVDGKKVVVK